MTSNIALWNTLQLRDLSDLHVLAISQASLTSVEAVYELHPLALTDGVIEDAFSCGANLEVLQFLVKKKELSEARICELVAKRFLDAIPLLQSSREIAAEAVVNLTDLVHTFPEGLVNSDGNYAFCALSIVLLSTVFPQNLLDSIIRNMPKEDRAFDLRSNKDLPTDATFCQQMKTTLDDDRSMRAIGRILEKLGCFFMCRTELSRSEFTKLLAMLFRANNITTKVHIIAGAIQEAASNGSVEEILGPLRKALEERESEALQVDCGTAEAGLLLPLLDAANHSDTLTELRLQNLENQAEVEIYQDKMLELLGLNTQLEVALICVDLTLPLFFANKKQAMEDHINEESFLNGEEVNSKQRLVDYKTLLNTCGRGNAGAEGTRLGHLVDLISPETIWKKLDHLNFPGGSKQELITILQHGLLCEQPVVWSSKEAQPAANSGQSRQKHPRERRDSRKRKATEPLHELSS
ncbi:expressed unknown protein [Seminavis robusta]|uniref:Uncharacterized protein n=1 Tax=Seminavis robusta TaxID=568900 RepID=A0A9N8DR77_9STRA|nr:expressed unknown protein [Seminavis robusta]|eukprot:Sro197_g083920.1 n/a (466) ;mRNA; r:85237-86819